jgi:hypothetical protein
MIIKMQAAFPLVRWSGRGVDGELATSIEVTPWMRIRRAGLDHAVLVAAEHCGLAAGALWSLVRRSRDPMPVTQGVS